MTNEEMKIRCLELACALPGYNSSDRAVAVANEFYRFVTSNPFKEGPTPSIYADLDTAPNEQSS